MSEISGPKILCSVEELASVFETENVVIFDCRSSLADFELGRRQYLEGHIPGARFLDMELDLSGSKDEHSGRHPIPSLSDFEAAMQNAGVSEDTLVIAYDEIKPAGAARLWWLLKYFGFSNVRVLDGGLAAWRSSGHELSSEVPESERGTVKLTEGGMPVLTMEDLSATNSAPELLIDSREAVRFRGEMEPIDPIAGRIPGAVNYFWQDVTTDTGILKPVSELKEYWACLEDAKSAAAYCGSGVTAAVNLLSMHVAGYTDVALYNGSWSQWCSYPDSPIERDV